MAMATTIMAVEPGTDSAPSAESSMGPPVLLKWSAGPVSTKPTPTPDLAALTGKPVKFRFHLRNARLFAFQVTAEKPA